MCTSYGHFCPTFFLFKHNHYNMNIYKLNSLEFKHKLSITWGWKIRKYIQKQAGNQNWSKSFLYYAIKYLQYKAKSLRINFHVSYWCDQLLWGGWRLVCMEVHKQTNKQTKNRYIHCLWIIFFVCAFTNLKCKDKICCFEIKTVWKSVFPDCFQLSAVPIIETRLNISNHRM